MLGHGYGLPASPRTRYILSTPGEVRFAAGAPPASYSRFSPFIQQIAMKAMVRPMR